MATNQSGNQLASRLANVVVVIFVVVTGDAVRNHQMFTNQLAKVN